MATATLTLPNGTSVVIEGDAAEVKELIAHFAASPADDRGLSSKSSRRKQSKKERVAKKGAQGLIADLADDNFFKTKRTIGDVQRRLEQDGHIYPQTALSMPLLRLTRRKMLRRIRDKDGWVYVS